MPVLFALLFLVGFGTWSAPSPLSLADGGEFGRLERFHIREAGILTHHEYLRPLLQAALRDPEREGDDSPGLLPELSREPLGLGPLLSWAPAEAYFSPRRRAAAPQNPRAPPSHA